MYRNRGFTVPIVVLLTLLFLLLPVIFLYTFNSNSAINVRGTTSKIPNNSLSVRVKSPNSSWDLQQYLCKHKDDCQTSLESGKRYATVSGGKTQNQLVIINRIENVEDYKYLKVFVKPSWGSNSSGYTVTSSNSLSVLSAEKLTVEENNLNYEILLIPLDSFSNITETLESIEFKEN
jgi:hypothetical protein